MSAERGIVAVNCGSSSVKAALFVGDEARQRRERVVVAGDRRRDHARVAADLLAELCATGVTIEGVAHRLVHGGLAGTAPRRIDEAVLASLRTAVPFARLHLPAEIAAIEATTAALPHTPQVGCFDTDFHARLPELSARYPLPEELCARGLRRYGFHGLSYEHIVDRMGPRLASRVVIAHLGNGASLAAVRDGVSIDTTMGLTPTGGLVMGTRTGDLDPGVLIHLLTHERYDVARVEALVTKRGGLLALSGTTADMKSLLTCRATDHRAALAVAVFCRQVQKGIAAMAVSLGGIDQLIFTGGIGAHAPEIRAEICAGVGFLGVALDEARNREGQGPIGAEPGGHSVFALTTDEELVLARHARRLLGTV